MSENNTGGYTDETEYDEPKYEVWFPVVRLAFGIVNAERLKRHIEAETE